MRTLLPAPDAALDSDGQPRIGSFRGGVAHVDLSRMAGTLRRIARHKRWLYLAIASEDLWIAAVTVRLGYASSAFAFVYDKAEKRMLLDTSSMGPPFAATIGNTAGEGCIAAYRLGGTSFSVKRERGSQAYAVTLRARDLAVDARMDASNAPPSLTAIAPLGRGLMNTTEKRTLLDVQGEATVRGVTRSLDGALAGYDYTNGLLARHTAWKWAFALGRATTGERVAFNLVQGFVGEPECAAWVNGELFPLREGRFEFEAEAPLSPWRIRTADDAVDLAFTPGGMHAEHKDLRLVRSRFVQPVGTYTGTMRIGGLAKTLKLENVLGVSEDQDVLW